jgi:hypothetical protein
MDLILGSSEVWVERFTFEAVAWSKLERNFSIHAIAELYFKEDSLGFSMEKGQYQMNSTPEGGLLVP